MSNEPTLTEAVQSVIDRTVFNMHTALPATIEQYDASTCTASVKPVIQKRLIDETSLSLPVIEGVPVVWMRTVDAQFSFPLNRGDGVLLIICERAIDFWLDQGREGLPTDDRKFDLTDAVAIPGFFSSRTTPKNTDNNKVALTYKNSSITINNSGQVDINDGNLTVDL